MPDKPDEEIRKSIKRFEESLPESERNPDAQRFALPALGRGRRSRPARKMLRRRKLLEIAAESPASGVRSVGRRFDQSRACYELSKNMAVFLFL